MPIEGIVEEDEEGNRVIVLRESKKSMTKSERKIMEKFERNMCPTDYDYEDDFEPVAPI